MKKNIFILALLMLISQGLGHANTQVPAGNVSTNCSTWSKNLNCTMTNQQLVDNAVDQLTSGGGGTPGSPVNSFQYNNGGNFAGGNMFQVGGNVGVGTSSALNSALTVQGTVTVQGNTSQPFTITGVNVGIGSSVPGQQLDVNGTVRSTSGGYVFPDGSTQTTAATSTPPAGSSGQYQYNGGSGSFAAGNQLVTDGTNVGIGTSPVNAKLSVLGGFGLTTAIFKSGNGTTLIDDNAGNFNYNNGNGFGLYFDNNVGQFALSDRTTQPVFITSNANQAASANIVIKPAGSGNVGIGTMTPLNFVDIHGAVNSFSMTTPNAIGSILYQTGFFLGPGFPLMYFTSSNVGIGTSLPDRILDVVSSDPNTTVTTASLASLGIKNTNSTTNNFTDIAMSTIDTNGSISLGSKISTQFTSHAPGAVSGNMLFINKNAGTTVQNMVLTANGNLGVGSATPGTKLDVQGTVRSIGFALPTGASSGYFLTSDASGNGSWGTVISGLTPGKIPKSATSSTINDSVITQTGSNIGIGSSTPGQTFDVQGTIRASSNIFIGAQPLCQLNGTNCPTATAAPGGGLNAIQYNNGTVISGNESILSFNGSNVGIGTTNATSGLLSIIKTGSVNPLAVSSVAGAGGDFFKVDSNGNIGIGTTLTTTGGVSILNGNVGIGTWNPSAILQVGAFRSSSSGFEVDQNGNVGIGTTNTAFGALSIMNGNVGIGTWKPLAALSIIGGNVSIGTTTATNALNLSSGASLSNTTLNLSNAGGTSIIENSSSSSGSQTRIIGSAATNGKVFIDSTNSASASGDSIVFRGGVSTGTVIATMLGTGNVGIGSTTPNFPFVVVGNVGIGTVATGSITQGFTGSGVTSCVCKNFINGWCVSATCS